MNNDLISREALKKTFENTVCIEPMPYAFVKQIIDNAPTVEVGYLTNCANCERVEKIRAKRPHGKWIEQTEYNGDTYYDCSICGNSWSTIDGTPWNNGMNYCPNCGAKMDGGEE